MPFRPQAQAQAWLRRVSTTSLCSWSKTAAALCRCILGILLDVVRSSSSFSSGNTQSDVPQWLPRMILSLLSVDSFICLPEETQLRVLDLIYYCPQVDPDLLDAVRVVLCHPNLLSPAGMDYLLEVRQETCSTPAFSFLLCLFLAYLLLFFPFGLFT